MEWEVILLLSAEGPYDATVTFAWDVSGVPTNYTNVALLGSDRQRLADMRTSSQYQFTLSVPSGGLGAKQSFFIQVSKFVPQQMSLKKGWNLVSLTVQPSAKAPGQILKDVGTFSIFGWNGETQSYYIPTEIVPGEAYWVAVFKDATQTIMGAPVEQFTRNVAKGWALIGSAYLPAPGAAMAELVTGGPLGLTLFGWNPETQSYEATTTIEPGRGYWLAAFDAATIKVRPKLGPQ
jgi:hypothetical protein